MSHAMGASVAAADSGCQLPLLAACCCCRFLLRAKTAELLPGKGGISRGFGPLVRVAQGTSCRSDFTIIVGLFFSTGIVLRLRQSVAVTRQTHGPSGQGSGLEARF
jgi:hypothetical protein